MLYYLFPHLFSIISVYVYVQHPTLKITLEKFIRTCRIFLYIRKIKTKHFPYGLKNGRLGHIRQAIFYSKGDEKTSKIRVSTDEWIMQQAEEVSESEHA